MAATADSSQGLRKRPVESSKPSSPVSSEEKQKAAPKGRPNVTVSASSVLCNFDGGMALGSNDIKELTFTTNEKTSEDAELGFSVAFYVMTLLTVVTRLWGIGHPSQVVFDEVHFGKFASYYLRREYFFDVHPPLAKMLIALAGFFLGYDGHFLFENIGDDYITNHVPHIGFRVFCASFGILVVPVAFLTLKEMGLSLPATILGSALLLLDNATIAQTRLILLDSQLMLFCTLTVYCWVRFYKQRFEPFKKQWWKWLILTGVSLALTLGVKMVGLFAFATIGTATIVDLWERLDIKRGLTIREFARHFSARALCLIFLPLALYLSFFYVHFLVLTKSGPGDDFMSTAFQEGLEGNKILSATTIIPYYSNITLKHKSKVWLHSHQDKYPLRYKDGRVSSQGQQITGYPHQDQNNLWVLEPVDPEMYKQAPKYVPDEKEKTREVRYLKNNDIVRLRHFMTDSYLITHDVASPMTPTNMEMTTIASNLADTRYVETLWHIEIPDPNLNDNILIESNRYDIRVRNVQHAVALTNTKKVLPDWGFKQNEINGNKKIDELANNWMIDSVQHERMVDGHDKDEEPGKRPQGRLLSFTQKFNELQGLMLYHNSKLTSSHPYSSHPISWPFVMRGISYWENKDGWKQIYVLGNPFMWWFIIVSIGIFLGLYLVDLLLMRRGMDEFTPATRKWWLRTSGFLLAAWGFHYFPFFLMGRQLFLHHYLPAYIFSTMIVACLWDFIFRVSFVTFVSSEKHWNASRLGTKSLWIFVSVLLVVFTWSFFYFSPLSYGTGFGSLEQLESRKWFKSWDIQHARK